ncbi:MAG: hypothetical protein LBI20_03185 [Holosporales bacterium]|jgi:thiol-disulfide isomerase/thioredoxin|nr:hypothetical protein [Holosporales bacterium]
MSIFVKKGEKLIKKEIDKGTLKKALLIFVGEWCPHCEAFLQSFKESVRILALYGVHIVFVYVPQPPVLQNWRDPTLTEYKSAEEKLAGWGIDVNQPKVSLTMLGSSPDLRRAEVNSLPVAIAVKDGKEVFRGEGSSLVQTLDMRALPTLVDFASILNDDAAQTPDEADKGSESSDEKGSKGKRKKGDKGRRRNDYKKGRASAFGSTSVNREAASHATKLLNEGRSFYTRGTPSESHRSDSQRTGCSCRL